MATVAPRVWSGMTTTLAPLLTELDRILAAVRRKKK
jgi:hypothetical protein